jgi:aminoglycoside phosphotransferase (APT) family kinase protein
MADLQGRVEPESVGLVHGSFDTDNVLMEPGGPPWLVDLEAARPGPVSLDVASMIGSLLESSRVLAADWVDAAERALIPSWNPVNVAGYLLLRTSYREEAGVLATSHRLAVVAAAERLMASAVTGR